MAKRNGRRVAGREVEHRMNLPGLSILKGSVSGQDVVVGAAVGLGASAGIKYLLNTYAASLMTGLPAIVVRFMPTLTGIAAGGLLYTAQKRSNSARAKAHFVGAVAAGVSVNVWQELQARFPSVGDYVSVPTYGGMLVRDRGMGGMLVEDSGRNLAELQSLNMEADDESAAAL